MQPIKFTYSFDGHELRVTLVDCLDYLSHDYIADQLYSRLPQTTNSTEILVLRLPIDTQTSVASWTNAPMTPFSERMPDASIHILSSWHFEIGLSPNLNPKSRDRLPSDEVRTHFLNWLREEELRSFVDSSSALFQARPNSIFYSPSGRYTKNFLRVGSIQTSRRVLDAAFFWAIPYLSDCTAVVCETWSISSIALNMGRLLERYRNEPGFRCRVDMLSRYHDESSLFREEIRDAFERVRTTSGSTLVLISCVMTGNSFALLRDSILDIADDSDVKYLSIYLLDSTISIPSLCKLCNPERDPDFSASFERPNDAVVISMDRRTYFPVHITERRIPIYRDAAQLYRAFFQAYKATGTICMHRTAVDRNRQSYRHHGIYIDVLAMLTTVTFNEKLREAVASLSNCPELIIVPPHEAGIALAEAVNGELQRLLGRRAQILIAADLDRDLSTADKSRVRSLLITSEIMVIDDVSVTGSRLKKFQQRLREIRFEGRIIYFVGAARPENIKNWRSIVVELQLRSGFEESFYHRVIAIEELVLPDWNKDTCPWCQEFLMLDKYFGTAADVANDEIVRSIRSRIRRLDVARDSGGLTNDAIWTPANSSLRLTENSLFLTGKGASEADVIGAVAACIQVLRTDGYKGNRLETSFPSATLVGAKEYLGAKFNDPILRCAIIRSCYRQELECWTDTGEGDRERQQLSLLTKSGGDSLEIEFAVQIALRKLPVLKPQTDDVNIFVGAPGGGIMLCILRKAGRLREPET